MAALHNLKEWHRECGPGLGHCLVPRERGNLPMPQASVFSTGLLGTDPRRLVVWFGFGLSPSQLMLKCDGCCGGVACGDLKR